MAERPVLDRIDELVSEEHELWTESSEGRQTDEPAPDPDVPRDIP